MKPELSYLAHNLVEIDKYRVETCCVIGKCKSGLIKGYADKMQMESRRLIKKHQLTYKILNCCCFTCILADRTACYWHNPNHFCLSSTGNYYSLRSQHEKAALYFQRALKLNPRCLGAWTLMGHEYMEMRNTSAAIQAYRSDWRCCRARWFYSICPCIT